MLMKTYLLLHQFYQTLQETESTVYGNIENLRNIKKKINFKHIFAYKSIKCN